MRIDEYYNSLITSLLEIIFDLTMMNDFCDIDKDQQARNQCFIDQIYLNTKVLWLHHYDLCSLKDIKRILSGYHNADIQWCTNDSIKRSIMIADLMINLAEKDGAEKKMSINQYRNDIIKNLDIVIAELNKSDKPQTGYFCEVSHLKELRNSMNHKDYSGLFNSDSMNCMHYELVSALAESPDINRVKKHLDFACNDVVSICREIKSGKWVVEYLMLTIKMINVILDDIEEANSFSGKCTPDKQSLNLIDACSNLKEFAIVYDMKLLEEAKAYLLACHLPNRVNAIIARIDFMCKNKYLPLKKNKEDESLAPIMKKINNIGDEIRWVNLKSEKLNYAFDNLKDCIKNNRTDVSQDVINDLFKTIRDALKDKPELNVSKLLFMLVEVEYDLRQRCMKIISDSAVPINPADDRFIKMKGAIVNSINGVLLKHYTEPVVETNIVSQTENEVKLEVTVKGDYNYEQKH